MTSLPIHISLRNNNLLGDGFERKGEAQPLEHVLDLGEVDVECLCQLETLGTQQSIIHLR